MISWMCRTPPRQAEIKAEYYELSLKYHPDVNKRKEAEHMFTGLLAYKICL